MTWVKICGITNLEDAVTAIDAGADAVGFVFYDKSPRKVDTATAWAVVRELPAKVEKVGVFVDQTVDQIRNIVQKAGLTGVQLHGAPATASVLTNPGEMEEPMGSAKLIVVVPLGQFVNRGIGMSLNDGLEQKLFALMFDSSSHTKPGGTGHAFDWEEYRGIIQSVSSRTPVIIAGGLKSTNVAQALELFRPFGVDVSSGVEAHPGKKDPVKVRAFVEAVRRADDNA
jgi:phosphoribosylanthranilate isomerase